MPACSNVRLRSPFDQRALLSSRPGLSKAYAQNVSTAAAMESFTYEFRTTRDTCLEGHEDRQDDINGLDTSLQVGNNSGSINDNHLILYFDLSTIATGSIVTSAPLEMYVPGTPQGGAWAGKIYRVTQLGWVEAQANWDDYATSTPWTASGGDYSTTTPAGIDYVAPIASGWHTFADLATHVQYAVDSVSGKQLHILLRRANQAPSTMQWHSVRSREFTDGITGVGAYAAKITVTFEVAV